MSGFQFPPPPPPPPTNNTQQVTQNYQSGGSGNQRGRGRGRGGDRGGQRGGRGRGRGQYGSGQIPYEAPSNHRNGNQTPQSNAGHAINGSYTPQLQSGYLPGNWNLGPQDYPQSYHDITTVSQAQQGHFGQRRHGDAQRKSSLSGPPRTFDGHKRKLDALRVNEPRKVAKNGPATAPSVPSFGTPVFSPRPQETSRVQPQKRSLGLTPGDADPVYSSSESGNEDEDVDEEKLYKALGEGLTFEHNGSIMSLNNVADLAEWIKERKENFPASFRLSEKEEKKRRIGAERKRLLAEAKAALGDRIVRQRPQKLNQKGGERVPQNSGQNVALPKKTQVRRPSQQENSGDNGAEALDLVPVPQDQQEHGSLSQATPTMEATAKLPKPDSRSTSSMNHLDASMEPGRVEANNSENKLGETEQEAIESKPEAEEQEEDDSSSIASTSSDDSSSDDEPPETLTTKPPPLSNTKRKPCKFFSATGRCRDGDACRFKHELKPEAAKALKERRRDPYAPILDEPEKGSKLSIHQRLLEQEEEAEEKLALQVIKYLGKLGMFDQRANGQSSTIS
ncbi:hypothetical protein HII31_13547 [Pseudocercospora fuligena]|uniref:C3H1-type domain-containing protein n=1 Tax=Pseudocercospora fuligena TaxID=685502 RepID=A0A8H6R7K3_9PEZI|nr:hypothetical protein HII31_13547 [Pseudocercospora fuligena]